MRNVLTAALFLLVGGALSAQESLNAIVMEDIESFTMSSPYSGNHEVRRTVLVFNDAGLGEAVFQEYTDQFQALSSFKGTVEKPGSKPFKIKKEDLQKVSLASGLAEDGYLIGYVPSATYPFTVTYEYSMSYQKGIASFPSFTPVSSDKVMVKKASYTLQVPPGTIINSFSVKAGEVRKETGTVDTYTWDIPVFEGFTEENLMPSWLEMVPVVKACPVDFVYGGVPGSQGSWEDVGAWCYGLKEGREDLPVELLIRLKEMTDRAPSDLEKIRILYDYLRKQTRYVSVQLGIGGYKPFPATQVYQSGFGDCKGLSNFMQAMLDAVGIPSYYTIVNTDRDRFLPGYSGIGQMNHAMLCVPLPELKDTLWLECTSPSLPLGYRHQEVAGHDVVLATAEGGIPVRVSPYPDSLNRDYREIDIYLNDDGSAKASARISLYLREAEEWIGVREWKPGTQHSRITAGLIVQPQSVTLTGIKDNFNEYKGPDYCPWIELDYSFDTRQYATVSNNRLFLPVNPYPLNATLQRGKRQNDLVNKSGGISRTTTIIHIPDGYTVESLPAPVNLDTEWGSFSATVQKDEGIVTVIHEFRTKSFRESPDRYDSFRTFIRAATKAYSANIVLSKQ